MKRVLAVATLAATAACTSLETSSNRVTADRSLAAAGAPYELPMLQYDLKVTRALNQCMLPDAEGKPSSTHRVVISTKVEAEPRYVGGETYVVDYRKLSSVMKITSFSIDYHEGTNLLKSLNASAEDRSAQVIEGVVDAGLALASLAGAPLPSRLPEMLARQQVLVCTAEARKKLEAVRTAASALKTASGNLKPVTERVQFLQEQLAAGALDATGKQELLEKLDQQKSLARAVTAAESAVQKATAAVSSVEELRWPARFADVETSVAPHTLSLSRLTDLLTVETLGREELPGDYICDPPDDPARRRAAIAECLEDRLSVRFELQPAASQQAAAPGAAGSGEELAAPPRDTEVVDPALGGSGVFVRPPATARLRVCQPQQAADDCAHPQSATLLRTDWTMAPQLGQLRFFPFSNGMFQDNVLTLALGKTGEIQSFSYREDSAAAETAAAAAAGALDAVQTARGEWETAEDAALEAERSAQLSAIQFEIDRLTRQEQLEQLQQDPAVSELATVQADTELVNARVAYLEAQLAQLEAEAALAEAAQ